MLPNFKKTETEVPKLPSMATGNGSAAGVAARPPSMSSRPATAPSLIGADLLITGNLTSKGEVQIEGEVQGDINGTNVVVGERARITGSIVADEVIVRGHVMGSVRGKRVMLQASSRIEGDVYHQSLSIEQGAFFEGKSRRSDDPMGVATQPAAAAADVVSPSLS